MKDNPEFNIGFVGLVAETPCLYDFTRADYNSRTAQEHAWEKIASGLMETVENCKERWKNIRGCFTRHLKNIARSTDGRNLKKPYYLAEHLSFLRPFTKSRGLRDYDSPTIAFQHPKEDYDSPAIPFQRSKEDYDLATIPFQRLQEDYESISVPLQVSKKVYDEEDDTTSEYEKDAIILDDNRLLFKRGRKRATTPESEVLPRKTKAVESSLQNPDLAFLISVLPDMQEMNGDQKRRFKIGMLNLAGQILSEGCRNNSEFGQPEANKNERVLDTTLDGLKQSPQHPQWFQNDSV